MATRLKLLFRDQQSALLLRSLAFAGLWAAAVSSGFGTLAIILFTLGALLLFSVPPERGVRYAASFAALLIFAVIGGRALQGSAFELFFAIPLGAAFFAIAGLKGFYFISRSRWHYATTLVISYGALIFLFSLEPSRIFVLGATLLFIITFFVWREFFRNYRSAGAVHEIAAPGEERILFLHPKFPAIAAGVLSLLVTEVALGTGMLPITPFGAASISFLVLLLLTDAAIRKSEGIFSRRALLTEITVFTLITMLIFASAG